MLLFLVFATCIIAGIFLSNWMMVASSCTMLIFTCLICILGEISKTRKALEQIEKYFKDKYLRGD